MRAKKHEPPYELSIMVELARKCIDGAKRAWSENFPGVEPDQTAIARIADRMMEYYCTYNCSAEEIGDLISDLR